MLKIFEMKKRSLEKYSGNCEKFRKLELLVNKIVNSVMMNHVMIDDGCLIQGSIVCSSAHLQEWATLKY